MAGTSFPNISFPCTTWPRTGSGLAHREDQRSNRGTSRRHALWSPATVLAYFTRKRGVLGARFKSCCDPLGQTKDCNRVSPVVLTCKRNDVSSLQSEFALGVEVEKHASVP